MPPVSLALVWHQHQPYYPDDVGGETLMPWVRLHATKDYWGMAAHLKEVPEFRCTINLVPSLLKQLRAYTEHGASDRHLDVSRIPADGLGENDARFLIDSFFMANFDTMIRPYPRYHELYQKRSLHADPVERALTRFNERDLRDLQIWYNLTWMHPLLFEADSDLKTFLDKGQNWSEADKHWLLRKQMDVMKQVIPLHKELSDSGQVELTTTPFFHPILPLLWDKRSARQAMPNCNLPRQLEPYTEDAILHLKRAVDFHREIFGVAPRGMWPSEGSVSQEILAAIADVGIEWIATDEEILSGSTHGWVSRDGNGFMQHPEMLYRPWRLEEQGKPLNIIFRDHALSDLIGFHYQRANARSAADDLLGKLEAIGRAVEPVNQGRPALVPIILDGENCWEYFPDGGVAFLREFYRGAAARSSIRPVRVSDALREHPPTDRINQLFAGSWISHNFAIWIGHEEDNTAWDLLYQTREFLKQTQASGSAPEVVLKRCWEEIYIAEGSDWFWWFGDDHSSAQDALFDQLFRKHLKNVYLLLNIPAPSNLDKPIGRGEVKPIHTLPKGFLSVRVDGRQTYFEWINAGKYVAGSERGTMTMVTKGLVAAVYFGFDPERFLLRVDTERRANEDLRQISELRVSFSEPAGTEVRVHGFATGEFTSGLYRDGKLQPGARIDVAAGRVLELAINTNDLQLNAEKPVEFVVDAIADSRSLQRIPQEGSFTMTTPSRDFELLNWQA